MEIFKDPNRQCLASQKDAELLTPYSEIIMDSDHDFCRVMGVREICTSITPGWPSDTKWLDTPLGSKYVTER